VGATTTLPVYHDHPHKRDEIQQSMTNDLEAQTRRAMDDTKQTLEAAGASFKDVVHVFVLRGPAWATLARRAPSSTPILRPTITSPHRHVAVLELGEPEQLIEIQVVAVVD
jgi:enamine deaminase RidA (YjgF/YER057c/UK114 family)